MQKQEECIPPAFVLCSARVIPEEVLQAKYIFFVVTTNCKKSAGVIVPVFFREWLNNHKS